MNPLLLLAMLMGLRGQFSGAGQTGAPLGGLAGTPTAQSGGPVPLFSSFGALLRGQINPEFRPALAAGLRRMPEGQRPLPPLAELVARGDPWAIATAQARAESAARGTRIDALMDELNRGLFANTEFLVPAPRGPFFRDPFTRFSM
jgi:hypothetical protein